MATHHAPKETPETMIKRRKRHFNGLKISWRLAKQAREESKTDPKAFAEYLTLDIYHEMLLSEDAETRHKAAREMLAYTKARKTVETVKVEKEKKTSEAQAAFSLNLPKAKEAEKLPKEIQDKIHQIKSGTGNS